MTTPFDPAIAATKFVLAFTRGMPQEQWKREYRFAELRLQSLERDAAHWARTHATV